MSAFENIIDLTSFKEPRDKVIPRKKVGKILEAGRNTPSPGNVQTLEFIAIEDDEMLEKLAQSLGDHRIAESPVTVAVIVDEDRMGRKVGSHASEFCMAEAATAVQNMRVVAQEEGISSIWRAGFDTATVSQQLEVPSDRKVVATVSFAFTDNPIHSEPRFRMNEMVYYDSYGNQIKSLFDGVHWRGLDTEKKIYSKKVEGLIERLKGKVNEVL